MSELNLEEYIERFEEMEKRVAADYTCYLSSKECKQIAEWLKELKKYREAEIKTKQTLAYASKNRIIRRI